MGSPFAFTGNLLSSDNRGIIPQFVLLVKGFFKKIAKNLTLPVDKPRKMCYTTLVNAVTESSMPRNSAERTGGRCKPEGKPAEVAL